MPMAIQMATTVAAAPAGGRVVTARSENLHQEIQFDLNQPAHRRQGDWSDYLQGVARVLDQEAGPISGAHLLIAGDVPLGSGLSSSASLEVAVASALLGLSEKKLAGRNIALLCQRAENEFAGSRCGIMDQFTACLGRAGHAILLDCRSLDSEYLRVPSSARILVSNTMVKHELASSEYNRRREECEEGVHGLAKRIPGIESLRDVTIEQLEQFGPELDKRVLRRCRHVVTENARTLAGAAALKRGDLAEFGRLMIQSHESLRDDYEVSCKELDIMVELARGVEGVYGSRMTGGGFGGCTVSLVDAVRANEFASTVAAGYFQKTGITPDIYACMASAGASEEIAEELG